MTHVLLEQVVKRFPDGNVAVDHISLEVVPHEFLVLVGPSGCGKSSTLRMIAGLESVSEGHIKMDGRVVNDVAPKDRNIAMVFQNYALYPHMTVYRNLSFGLLLRYGGGVIERVLRRLFKPRKSAELNRLRSGVDDQVRQTADRLAITRLLGRKPYQLSGGERQRVALGRAIVRDPAVFLFDEPLSNLDAKLRQKMRLELKRLHRELDATMIYVTHDQIEAMTMGDRIAVMREGRLLQVGTPMEVYQRPHNTFVAQFIGSVPMNLVEAEIWKEDTGGRGKSGLKVSVQGVCRWITTDAGEGGVPGNDELPVSKATAMRLNSIAGDKTRRVQIGFRAEHGEITTPEPTGDTPQLTLTGNVASVDNLGDSTLIEVELHSSNAPDNEEANDKPGSDEESRRERNEQLEKAKQQITIRSPGNRDFDVPQEVTVAIDPAKLTWFDPVTGNNLDREHS